MRNLRIEEIESCDEKVRHIFPFAQIRRVESWAAEWTNHDGRVLATLEINEQNLPIFYLKDL